MRRILLLAVCSLLTSVLLAGPVTKEQAQQVASQFLAGKSVTHRAPALDQLRTEVVLNAVDESGQPYLYAISQDKANGFVIVSGDDRFRSILGYSQTGSFDSANMPDNMRAWLQGYIEEMKYYIAKGYQPQTGAAHRAAGVKKAISPLIQTLWDQGEPFNNLVKEYNNTGDAVTGCVATAMAQVMYYAAVKHGDASFTTTVEIPEYTTSTLGKNIPAISAGTVINWSGMIPQYVYSFNSTTHKYDIPNFTDAQATAVATLMKCCGVSVKMNYKATSSGASSYDVPNAMKTYFGFDETVRIVSRGDYSYADWLDLVYAELAAARPVMYSGQSSGGGHSFVVDGYDGDELFHVNWGWGGWQDDYFVLSVLNSNDNSGIGASSSNDGYSFSQDAIIGIQTGTGKSYTEPKKMTFQDLTIAGNVISTNAWNFTGAVNEFDYGFAYIDGSANIETITILENRTYNPKQGYPVNTTIGGTTKPAGTYKIIRVSKLSSASEWVVQDNEYVEAVFEGSSVTLTKRPITSLTVTAFNFTGSKFVNQTQPVEVTIKNNGDEFYGLLYLFASTTEAKGDIKNYGGVTITKGGTATTAFEFKPATTGTYNIWIATDDEGTNVIGQTTVTITNATTPEPTSDNVELSFALDVLNKDGENIIGKTANVKVTATNATEVNFEGRIGIFSYIWNGYSYSANSTLDNVIVPANSSKEIVLTSQELTGGDSYSFMVFYFKGESQVKLESTMSAKYTPIDAVTTYDAAGNPTITKATSAISVPDGVAFVDLRGQTTTNTITSQANPNTLFIVDEGFALSGATNVIEETSSGYKAANIVLQDNANGFVSPIDFHADEITYTRTFDKYYDNGKNWTTIVLPFAATKVKNTDGTLPWDEANRKFWLMEFNGETGSDVIFTTAPATLEANTPYIIALPGSDQGSLSLVDKNTLTFSADNADIKANAKSVVTVSSYKFVGTMTNTGSLENIYALNDDGDKFKKGTATVSPFRAYFVSTSAAATSTSLGINIGGSATGIESLQLSKPETQREGIYNLNGQRVSQPKKGLYIINGKKVIIK